MSNKYSRIRQIVDKEGNLHAFDAVIGPSPNMSVRRVDTSTVKTVKEGDKTFDVVIKSQKIVDVYTTIRCLTSQIDRKKVFERASIVPVVKKDGINYFFLCIDAKYKQITDPGGRIRSDEDFITGAVRELKEETMGIFDFTMHPIEYIRANSVSVYDNNMIIVFQRVDIESFSQYCAEHKRRYIAAKIAGAAAENVENSEMVWISEPDLRSLCEPGSKQELKMPADLYQALYPNFREEIQYKDRPVISFKPSSLYPKVWCRVRNMFMSTFATCSNIFSFR